MTTTENDLRFKPTEIPDPPVARLLFGDVRLAWLWLPFRVYLGWIWLSAGSGKMTNPAWVGDEAGTALSGFLRGAIGKAAGDQPTVQGWYADFLEGFVLPNAGWFGPLVAVSEFVIGLCLILGLMTGIAAFLGSVMNFNFLLAGTLSTNPILFVIATWLVLAWKTAGWIGLDRWALPLLGTPWKPGTLFRSNE